MQISVKNVTWDLRLKKAYIDGPQCPGGEDMADSAWSSNQEKKTYTDGMINNPNGTGKPSIQEKKKSCKTSFAFLVGILNSILSKRNLTEFMRLKRSKCLQGEE